MYIFMETIYTLYYIYKKKLIFFSTTFFVLVFPYDNEKKNYILFFLFIF